MRDVLSGIALFCIAIGLVQLTFLLVVGRRESRRARARVAAAVPGAAVDAVFALVPALDEELVIAATITHLLAQDEGLTVVVVDDASSDETAVRALAAGGERVVVHRRELPEARLGKGPALNAGIARIREQVAERGLDPSRVLVLVMDADGHLSEGAVAGVKELFVDPVVGGAQLGVRMRNRSTNWLTLVQDCEFWGVAALGQMGRVATGTVSLGGNGQFTRLSALDRLGDAPWSRSLTEDLDLAVSLAVAGWRLTSTPDAWVSQQAVDRVRPLLRQRTRWFQGHMTAANHRLREVWASPHLSNLAVLEMSSYLLIPYLMVLPWSILSQVAIAYVVTDMRAGRGRVQGLGSGGGQLLVLTGWYLISFLPTIICGIVYSRRERRMRLLRSIAFAHLLLFWNYVMFAACWAALVRIARGRTGWEKTVRLAEPAAGTTVPAAVSAAAVVATAAVPVEADCTPVPATDAGAERASEEVAPADLAPVPTAVATETPAKKATATAVPAKKVPAKKVPAKKAPAKKAPAKKVPAKKVPATKAPAKKVPATKVAPAKKAPATKVPAKVAPAKKVPAKKAPARTAAPAARKKKGMPVQAARRTAQAQARARIEADESPKAVAS